MYKVVHTGSFDMDDAPVRLMDVHSRGVDRSWMQKRAAVLGPEIAAIRPEPGKTFIHLIALGDSETFGPNRNSDGFTKRANVERHHTFVTNGHVFKHHANKDPRKASGQVKASAHNDAMSRVELVVALENNKWEDELQKLASGKDLAFSMACNVPFDVCSICGNKARTRAEYCEDMQKHAGQILEDGRQVYVDNPDPTFFDISGVFRPADRIAFHLQKVASDRGFLLGADLAEIEGVSFSSTGERRLLERPPSQQYFKKLSTLRKLCDIEKEIEAVATGEGNGHLRALGRSLDPDVCTAGLDDDEMEELSGAAQSAPSEVLAALGQARISLPLRDFVRLMLGPKATHFNTHEVEERLPGIFGRLMEDADSACADGSYDPHPGGGIGIPGHVRKLVSKLMPGLSMLEPHVGSRTMVVIARKKPEPTLTGGNTIHTIKAATDAGTAELLAREYAKYKLSFLSKVAESEGAETVVKLGVLQNYV